MNTHRKLFPVGAMMLVALAATGCVNKQTKQRIAILETTNVDLTNRLNACQTSADEQFAAQHAQRGELDGRLAACLADADALRAELATQPVPQIAAPGWTPVPGGAMITIENSILFAPGKAVLRSEAMRTLDAVVDTLQGQYLDKDIVVIGHTDNQPIRKSGWKDNWQLSTERGLAVVRHLAGRGIATGRILASGAGEFRPRTNNDTEKNRSRNRRVEIIAIDPITPDA